MAASAVQSRLFLFPIRDRRLVLWPRKYFGFSKFLAQQSLGEKVGDVNENTLMASAMP
jgi:hypothetical protein